jgi:two-component system response regulator HydG
MKKLTSLDIAALEAEYNIILQALKETNFNKAEAAKLLNVDRKTIYNKLKRFQESGLNKKIKQVA